MRRYFCSGLCLLVWIAVGHSQSSFTGLTSEQTTKLDKEVSQLQKDHPNAVVQLNEARMPLLLSHLDEGVKSPPAADRKGAKELVEGFLARYSTLFRANTTVLGTRFVGFGGGAPQTATSAFDYGPEVQDPFVQGRTVVTVQQTLNGLPVYGAEAKVAVNMEAASVSKFDGSHLVAPVAIDTTPKRSKEESLSAARGFYEHDLASDNRARQEEKALFPHAEDEAVATLLIADTQKLGLPRHELTLAYRIAMGGFVYFVDATDLSLIFSYRDLARSLVREVRDWNGNANQSTPPVMLNENGDQLTKPVSADATVARDNARVCYQHFLTVLSRDGLCETNCQVQKAPTAVVLNVEYGNDGSFWSNSLKQLYFGKGWAAPVEILCHEYTHAIVQFSSGLVYANESGAVSESIADFFGAIIRNNGKWVIGDTLPQWSVVNPLRDMKNPRKARFNPNVSYDESNNSGQPDSYKDRVSVSDPICGSLFYHDNGCVHINSGILNRAFVLAAEGGTDASGHNYVGMGRLHLEKTVYHALKTSIVSSTDLKSAAADIFDSCQILANTGNAGISPSECDTLHFAFVTVGLQ